MILLTAGSDVAPKNDSDLIVWEGSEKINLSDLLKFKDIKAIVCGDEPYTAEILDMLLKRNPNLVALSRAGNGWDNIDRKAAEDRGIMVMRQNGAYAEPVADSIMAMILAFARRLISLNKSMHEGKWQRERYPGVALNEVTVGIIGYGNIGKALAKRLEPFGARVIFHRPTANGVMSLPLPTLLTQSDFVVLCSRLSRTTRHMIGTYELYLMKDTAYLINVSRGGLVKTDALVHALETGEIAGAGLDVFEQEPLPEDHPLRQMDNVILTPHNSYWSSNERRRVVLSAINEAREWINQSNVRRL